MVVESLAAVTPTEQASRRLRVLMVDDHELFRFGMRETLEEYGFTVVGEACDESAAERLAAELAPDVAILDLSMPGMSGIEATRRIQRAAPEVRVVVLTVSADEEDVKEAILAGASGYLLKDSATEELVAGVRAAAGREAPLSPRIPPSCSAGCGMTGSGRRTRRGGRISPSASGRSWG